MKDEWALYQIEDCIGSYEIIEIAGKSVYIFESHNMAFPAWGTIASSKGQSYALITFDYHMDTRPPFSKAKTTGEYNPEWIQSLKLRTDDFSFEDAFRFALVMVAYDEQIKVACRYGYLNKYYVICNEDKETCLINADCDKFEGYKAAYFNKAHLDDFLESFLPRINDESIIVDFDVDFFNSENELNQEFFERIAQLLTKADAITIAKEKWHFENLRKSSDFKHEEAIVLLLNRLKTVIQKSKAVEIVNLV